jgi:hypothetical protein
MVRKILLIVAALLVAFLVVVAVQPSAYKVTRTTQVAASPEAAFAQVNDFHNWNAWSPWDRLDPAMKRTFEGSTAGPGAIYKWEGNDQVGQGQMTIVEAQPGKLVKIKLDFIKPFPSTSVTEFTFDGDGPNTRVTWTMTGENSFVAKAFMLFMGGMDKAVGPDFEKGLAQLKTAAESKRG